MKGQEMPMNRWRREPEAFEPDSRPGADAQVYCKGCGRPLTGEPRHQQPRKQVTFMMCEPCREKHGHALIPPSGAPTFCYRCGERDLVFISRGLSPSVHHVCARCLPDRAARYGAGNFEARPPEPILPPEATA